MIMYACNSITTKFPIALLFLTLLIAGCSGSTSSAPQSVPADDTITANSQNGNQSLDQGSEGNNIPSNSETVTSNETNGDASNANAEDSENNNSAAAGLTRVSFDITVPVYSSNALQVSVTSNNKNLMAAWVTDESWAVSDDFSSNTEHPLIVTFSDNNGAIVLGQVETQFVTGSSESQSITVSADQFNTTQWDDDGDGVSNLSELTAGSNPLGEDLPNPVQNELEILPVKTVRISWQATPGAEFYRVFENPDGVSGFEQISDDLDASIRNHDHRIALYARANAMYMVQACDAFSCSDSEAQAITGYLANAIGYFEPSFPLFQTFGEAVSLSADGMTLAVGSSFDGSPAQGINGDPTAPNPTPFGRSGSVHVFTLSAAGWVQQAYIKASDSARDLIFGIRLALSDDGNTMAVQALGKIYLFERLNDEWTETTILNTSGNISISLSGDGNSLAVASRSNRNIELFERSGNSWQQQSTAIIASDLETLTESHVNIVPSLSQDGNTLAIGASSYAVFLLERTDNSWSTKATLRASNADVSDRFGSAISLSANGKSVVVGAKHESSFASGVNGFELDNTKSRSGAAYIFVNNNGNWEQQAYLKAGVSDAIDEFGGAVSISANGDIVAIGAQNERGASVGINGDENDNSQDRPGAVYVFARNNGSWQQQAYVKAKDTDGFAWFGESISLSADGSALAVGAKYQGSGAAYLY